MKRILAQAAKEFRQFRRDRLTRTLTLVLPLVMITLYGTALTTNIRNLPLLVHDQDQSTLARRYVEAMAATGKFRFVPGGAHLAAEDAFRAGHARAALVIPAGFERDFRAGRTAQVQLLVDGTETNTALLLRNINAAVAMNFQPSPSPHARATPPVRLQIRHWYNPGLADALFFGSGALGLVLILFPALLGALAMAREFELGTVTQVYASALTAPQWVIGKAIPYVGIGLVQLVICYALGYWVFGYRMPENPLVLLVATVVYLTAGVLYGMVVGGATRTQSAAIQGVQFGAFLVSLMLSGFLVPVANMPLAMRFLSTVIPARHYIEITRDIMLRGGDWTTSAAPLGALVGLAALFFLANVRRLRRMRDPA